MFSSAYRIPPGFALAAFAAVGLTQERPAVITPAPAFTAEGLTARPSATWIEIGL